MRRPRRLMYLLIGLACVPLGLAGLVIPLLPGIPILLGAAACFAVAGSSGVAAGSGLGTFDRIKLEFLLGLERVLAKLNRRRRSPRH